MEGPAILPWLTPLVCAVFGIILLAIGSMRDELRNARLFALSYGFATVASIGEIVLPQADAGNFVRHFCEMFYIAATTTTVAAVTQEWRGQSYRFLILACATFGIAQVTFFWFVHGQLNIRVLANSLTNGGLLLFAGVLLLGRTRRRGDWFVLFSFMLLGSAVVGNGVFTYVNDDITIENYLQSRHSAFLNFIVSLGSLIAALSLIAHFGLKLLRMMDRLAVEDALAGTLNRRGFEDVVRPALARGGALVLTDIDHFKRVNDTYGHQAGDEVIRRLGRILLDVAPDGAFVGRIGGEEFCIYLPQADPRVARLFAEGARQAVASLDLSGIHRELSVTASFGFASGLSYDNTFRRADAALYKAKAAGRDQVRCGEAQPMNVANVA